MDQMRSDGTTSLHIACLCGHLDCVRLLLMHGADVELANEHDESPLQMACSNNHRQVVRCLLERGADPTKKDRRGRTAAICARSLGPSDLGLAEIMDIATRDRNAAIERL